MLSKTLVLLAISASALARPQPVAPGQFFQKVNPNTKVQATSTTTTATSATATSTYSSVATSTTSTSSSATPSASAVSASSGGKRGLAYNTASLTYAFSGDGMSWAYNWAASAAGSLVSGVEFVPMLWGLGMESGWSSAAQSAIDSGSSHLLSFNEPDLAAQANISPSDAATAHQQYMNPFAGSASIGSPAVTNGEGSSQGINWLTQWFEACNGGCVVDFVAFHWYNDASETSDFETHVQNVINLANQYGVSKVWLTEFGATGSDSAVIAFLETVLPWLDSQPAVEKYAYFEVDGIMASSSSSLTDIGDAYA